MFPQKSVTSVGFDHLLFSFFFFLKNTLFALPITVYVCLETGDVNPADAITFHPRRGNISRRALCLQIGRECSDLSRLLCHLAISFTHSSVIAITRHTWLYRLLNVALLRSTGI